MNLARENIMRRIKQSLGKTRETKPLNMNRRKWALDKIAEHHCGPTPFTSTDHEVRVENFIRCAQLLSSSVVQLSALEDVPEAINAYLIEHGLGLKLTAWETFRSLPFDSAEIQVEFGLAQAECKVGLTGALSGIAETGTVLICTDAEAPPLNAFLPETHLVVINRSSIVSTMEEAFGMVRHCYAVWPRGVHFVSGPSRTADIAQTLVMGAHGPYRVHLMIVG